MAQKAADSGQSDIINVASLQAAGFAKTSDKIKVLGNGKLTSKVNITVHAISASAQAAVEAAGGSVQIV